MTRRLTLAIVGVVAAALVVAGLGTLVLERISTRLEAERELVSEVADVAATAEGLQVTRIESLRRLRRALHLEDIALLFIGPAGRITPQPPGGVTRADLDVNALRAGQVLSGRSGSLVWAAAPAGVQQGDRSVVALVVATRSATQGTGAALRWFLLAAAVTLAVGVAVATRLGRALTGPVRDAQATTERIAGGDLTARLAVPADGRDDELAALARSINTMAATLERSKGLERQFLLSVSHDLRTPLTSIRGYAEAIADGTVDDPGVAAGVITTEARRLERLVRDLLDLAKLDARQFSLDRQPVDLVDIAAGTADGFRPEADDAGVSLAVDVPDRPIVVIGDPDRLAQVAANLVENALKFATSRVAVSAAADGSVAVLAVEDDGPGIAAHDLPHVFERLYVARARPRRKETGSGLGLALVRELVAAMDGTAAAEPSPLGGARLVVRLPLVP